jgi:serine/threonine protein kinase
MKAHCLDPIPRVSDFINQKVPEGIEDFLQRCLAKDPEDRFQTADELIAVVEQIELDP